ncbi:MAG: S-layer homology domain-containing protein, partial [Clostridia bacterium]|nr:S-layer homology domain-containing protein [Clostridia bacterium]
MKKFFFILLCLVLLLSAPVYAAAAFSDVKATDWFCPYVSDLTDSGVINGYPDGTFRPENEVRYNEALKLILLAAGYPKQEPVGGDWAGGYLIFARQKGFLPEEDLELTRSITRAEVAHLAARALLLAPDGGMSPFSDTNDPEVTALYNAGVIQGETSGAALLFSGDRSLRRSEVSAIVWRILLYFQGQAAVFTPPEDPQVILTPEGETPAAPVRPQEPADPSGTDAVPEGKIRYRDRLIDILEDVPVFAYDPKDFYLENGRMRCADRNLRLVHGIDVSVHQGIIDWKRVKE